MGGMDPPRTHGSKSLLDGSSTLEVVYERQVTDPGRRRYSSAVGGGRGDLPAIGGGVGFKRSAKNSETEVSENGVGERVEKRVRGYNCEEERRRGGEEGSGRCGILNARWVHGVTQP